MLLLYTDRFYSAVTLGLLYMFVMYVKYVDERWAIYSSFRTIVPFSFQVKIWFQNRRTKWKKQENISNAEAAEHKVHVDKTHDMARASVNTKPVKSESPSAQVVQISLNQTLLSQQLNSEDECEKTAQNNESIPNNQSDNSSSRHTPISECENSKDSSIHSEHEPSELCIDVDVTASCVTETNDVVDDESSKDVPGTHFSQAFPWHRYFI